jgi:cell wall-associated NlpC family hydrolase
MATATMPTGTDIAQDAMRYQGQPYTYGGRADHPGDWDCSSFVSYVLGHDLGLILPGGGRYGSSGYPPSAHGPVVSTYAAWNGATTLPAGQPPATGDLCVWNGLGPLGHIGIATDPAHMVSALDHESGTVHTPIQGYGPAGVKVVYRRLNGAGQVPGSASSNPLAGLAGALIGGALLGGGVVVLIGGAILGGAFVIGLVGAALVAAAARKAAGQ